MAAAENGDDALRAHVTTNYRDRRTAARLERFAAVLRAMIRSTCSRTARCTSSEGSWAT